MKRSSRQLKLTLVQPGVYRHQDWTIRYYRGSVGLGEGNRRSMWAVCHGDRVVARVALLSAARAIVAAAIGRAFSTAVPLHPFSPSPHYLDDPVPRRSSSGHLGRELSIAEMRRILGADVVQRLLDAQRRCRLERLLSDD